MAAARWPSAPPEGEKCDGYVNIGHDHTGKPVLHRCVNLAVETCVDSLGFETWLCRPCAESMGERFRVKRNPNRRTP